MPLMLQPVTAQKILDTWARKPLDFEPGNEVAVQQHEFCDCRIDRREGQRRTAAAAISARKKCLHLST